MNALPGSTHNTVADTHAGPIVQARSIDHLTYNAGPTTTPAPPLPRQLPRSQPNFVDRRDLLAELGRSLGRVMVLHGDAGVGKSALAVRALEAMPTPAGGQVMARLRAGEIGGPARVAEVLARMLRSLGHAGPWPDEEEAGAWWRTVTAERPVALLLDNAVSAEQVAPLLPAAGSTVIVTSRRPLPALALDGAEHHRLPALAPEDAADLLRLVAGGRRVADQDAARRLAGVCAYRPLLLVLAGARLRLDPSLPVCGTAVSTVGLPAPDPSSDVITMHLRQTHDLLPAKVAAAYRAAGVMPFTGVEAAALAAVLGIDAGDAEHRLGELERAGLADHGDGLWRLLPAGQGQEVAAALAGEHDGAALAAEQRRLALEWWLAALTRAERLITPHHRHTTRTYRHPVAALPAFATGEEAWQWLAGQEEQVRPALEAALDVGFDALVWQCVHALWPLWHRHRPAELWLWAQRVALVAVGCDGDELGQRETRNALGIALRDQHRYNEALPLFEEARDAAVREGDVRGQGQHEQEIGATLVGMDRLGEAVPHLDEALRLWSEAGYVRGTALVRIRLGEIEYLLGRQGEALAHLDRARRDLLEDGDVLDAARALVFRARALRALGDREAADEALLRAQQEFTSVGARLWLARVLELRAQAAEAAGQSPDLVADLLREALRADSTNPRNTAGIREHLERLTGAAPES